MFAFLALLVAVFAALTALAALRQIRALTARIAELEAGRGLSAPVEVVAAAPEATEPAATPPTPKARGWSIGATRTGVLKPLGDWLRANWIYPVAGAALVMAAIYLVQYSIDKGLLSPAARVGLAVLLGAMLIAGAEAMRRHWGGRAQLVPATLAGGGVVALLAAVLAAFHLYAMLDQTATLAALAGVAALAMVLGWVQGPLLAALGILAGAAAPFLLGEGGAPMDLLYAYFGAVALLGLGIDGLRRWGWVSALAVAAPLSGGVLIHEAGAVDTGLALLTLMVTTLALAVPGGALVPRATGAMIHQVRRARPAPEVLVAALAVVMAVLIVTLVLPAPVGVAAAGALAIMVPLWTRRAPALADLSALTALALPAAVVWSVSGTPMMRSYVLNVDQWLPVAAVTLAALAGLAQWLRSEAAENRARDLWALLAVATPGATLVAAELVWHPSSVIGAGPWAMDAMALAALFTALALRAARRDTGQGAPLGSATAAAFATIALALMLMLSLAALTVALAVLLAAAAAMDRRFGIPALGAFMGAASMALGWRLIVDPGLGRLVSEAPGGEVALTLVAVLAGPLAALALIAHLPRAGARDWGRIVTETGLAGMIPPVLAVIIARYLSDAIGLHAMLGIEAATLIAMVWVQRRRAVRLAGSPAMTRVRKGLAVLFGLAAALCLIGGVILFSPVIGDSWLRSRVAGAPLLNDLILAYGLPALVLWMVLRGAAGRLAQAGRVVATLLGALWVATMIRHLWQGGDGMALGREFAQGELYAYTVALLVAGAAALALALRFGATRYRLAGLGVIGLAAAKAFLVDAAGLEGLLRVGAFLGLGLSLAALAWLNAWVIGRVELPRVKE